MSKNRELGDYLGDILSAITEVDEFTRDMTFAEFEHDRKTINAVIRSLEVLGEAANIFPHLFATVTRTFPGVKWLACAAFRVIQYIQGQVLQYSAMCYSKT